jgi:erythromycin esterase-like protein
MSHSRLLFRSILLEYNNLKGRKDCGLLNKKWIVFFKLSLIFILIGHAFNSEAQDTSFRTGFVNLSSGDFAHLKEKLEGKQIILIGESSHGVYEFGEFKKEIIKYLVDSLQFSTVFIESGISDIYKWTSSGVNNYDSLVQSVFPIWQTPSYVEIFKYLQEKEVKVFGIDPQNSSKYFRDFPYQQLCKIDAEMAKAFYSIDKEWSKAYSKPILSWDSSLYQTQKKAIAIYDLTLDKIRKKDNVFSDPKDYLFLKRILENRLAMAKAINKSVDCFHRDSIMETNVTWIIKNILTTKDKIIILSHNAHVAKEKNMNVGYMGDLMWKEFNDKMFVIAQYFESGNFVDNSRKINSIPAPARDSFEEYLSTLDSEYNLFDMHNKMLPKKIFNKKITTYFMGGPITQELILSKNYDLIFTVKHAKASNLIKLN